MHKRILEKLNSIRCTPIPERRRAYETAFGFQTDNDRELIPLWDYRYSYSLETNLLLCHTFDAEYISGFVFPKFENYSGNLLYYTYDLNNCFVHTSLGSAQGLLMSLCYDTSAYQNKSEAADAEGVFYGVWKFNTRYQIWSLSNYYTKKLFGKIKPIFDKEVVFQVYGFTDDLLATCKTLSEAQQYLSDFADAFIAGADHSRFVMVGKT